MKGLPYGSPARHWPWMVAVILGLVITGVAAVKYRDYVNTHQEMVDIPVAARTIPPYTVIRPQDLTSKSVIKAGVEPEIIRDPGAIIGKLSLTTLYAGERFRPEKLGNQEMIQNKQVIGVNVDLTRCVGGWVQPGDIVDVWWVPREISSMTPGVGWTLIARNAVLLDLKDSTGRTLASNQTVSAMGVLHTNLNVSQTPPAVAVLAVDSSSISKAVGGSVPGSQSIVLTKKYSLEEPVSVNQPVPGQ